MEIEFSSGRYFLLKNRKTAQTHTWTFRKAKGGLKYGFHTRQDSVLKGFCLGGIPSFKICMTRPDMSKKEAFWLGLAGFTLLIGTK